MLQGSKQQKWIPPGSGHQKAEVTWSPKGSRGAVFPARSMSGGSRRHVASAPCLSAHTPSPVLLRVSRLPVLSLLGTSPKDRMISSRDPQLDHICKDPVSKEGHLYRDPELELGHYLSGVTVQLMSCVALSNYLILLSLSFLTCQTRKPNMNGCCRGLQRRWVKPRHLGGSVR